MEVEKTLHMNKGVGATSYANNSFLQKSVMEKSKQVVEESTREVYRSLEPKCFMISDMGCSSGPNTFLVISDIINAVDDVCRSLNRREPEFGVYLNDLPGNDFNALLKFLPSLNKWVEEEKGSDFGPCFVSVTPKSFYGRIFPKDSLHFVHSCYALHWLSKVPEGLVSEDGVGLNKGNIYIAKTSPPKVQQAYYSQFATDFTLFLRSRAKEIVPGGRMVLTFLGTVQTTHLNSIYELLGSTLHHMVLEGMIEEEKLDKFNVPSYLASVEEVRQLVESEGSFVVNKLESFTVDWGIDKSLSLDERSKLVAKTIRAVMESLLVNAFGQTIIDDLFFRFKIRVQQHMATQTHEYLSILLSLTKNYA